MKGRCGIRLLGCRKVLLVLVRKVSRSSKFSFVDSIPRSPVAAIDEAKCSVSIAALCTLPCSPDVFFADPFDFSVDDLFTGGFASILACSCFVCAGLRRAFDASLKATASMRSAGKCAAACIGLCGGGISQLGVGSRYGVESESAASSPFGGGFLNDFENPRVKSTANESVLVAADDAAAMAPKTGSEGPSSMYQSRCRILQLLEFVRWSWKSE